MGCYTWLVTYAGVRVKPEDVLPPATELSGLNGIIWVTYAANFLGTTEHVFDAAREYVMSRTRMDKPLGTFQAVAHTIAEAKIQIEAMRGLILNGIDHVTEGNADAILCFSAKVYCQKEAIKIIESLMELWGGVGVTEEAGIARYMRDASAAAISRNVRLFRGFPFFEAVCPPHLFRNRAMMPGVGAFT